MMYCLKCVMAQIKSVRRIRDVFTFPLIPLHRSYDAADGGGDSVKLKWETQLCGVKKKFFNLSGRPHSCGRGNIISHI